jgi:hypothetical protein
MAQNQRVRNLGPTTRRELRRISVRSRDDLAGLGWQEVCLRWVELFPQRLNLNAFAAIIGAMEDVDWRAIDPAKKEEARLLVNKLRRNHNA